MKRVGDKSRAKTIYAQRKRLPDVSKTDGLIALQEKLNSGAYVFETLNTYSITKGDFVENPCKHGNFLAQLKKLGEGTYGTVYNVKSKNQDFFIIKESKYDSTEVTTYSGTFVEPRLMYLFNKTMLLRGHTPHLPPLFGYAQCKYRRGKRDENGNNSSAFVISKRAEYGTLENYLNTYTAYRYDIARQVLFEAAYTLAVIQSVYPHFLHNDIKLNNVLADLGPPEGHTVYISMDKTKYYVPNSGMRLLIWDFDFSSILGICDNDKAAYFQYIEPESGISSIRDVPELSGLDLKVLANSILAHLIHLEDGDVENIDGEFLREWKYTWGEYFHIADRFPYEDFLNDTFGESFDYTETMPSPLDAIANSPMFEKFRSNPETNATDTYKMEGVEVVSDEMLQQMYHLTKQKLDFTPPPLAFGSKRGADYLKSKFRSAAHYPVNQIVAEVPINREIDWTLIEKDLSAFAEKYELSDRINEDAEEAIWKCKVFCKTVGNNEFLQHRWLILPSLFYLYEIVDLPVERRKISNFFTKISIPQIDIALVQWSWIHKLEMDGMLTYDGDEEYSDGEYDSLGLFIGSLIA